jgi:outer membrane protein assembly factor BamB
MPSRSRRALLRSIAAASAAGFAGCQDSPGTATDTTTRTTPVPPTDTATASPTETPTPLRCGPATRPELSWPLPERSAARDAYAGEGTVFTEAPSVAWTVEPSVPDDVDADPDEAAFGRPVVAGDRLYVVQVTDFGPMVDDPGGHAIQCRDPATGDLLWSHPLPSFPRSRVPAVRGDDVLATSWNAVHAVDRHDGTERWTRTVSGSSVLPTPDQVHVVGNSGVHALAPDGTERWTRTFEDGAGSVTVGGDRVYVTSGGTVSALRRSDGRDAWSERPEVGPAGHLLATDCAVFATQDTSGGVAAIALDGEVRWRAEDSVWVPATDGETLYGSRTGSEELFVSAVDAGSGEPRWEQPLPVRANGVDNPTGGPPVLVDGVVYVSLEEGLAALDTDDGEVLWRTSTPVGGLALADGTLFGVDHRDDGRVLYALR